MVIGKGLIANQFKHFESKEDYIIFASGVSNSKEINSAEFEREFEMIRSCLTKKALFIYFSTCSIYDTSLTESLYVKHKLKIEKFISENFSDFLILRLPNIIGLTTNSHTFFNFFYDSILSDRPLTIQKNTTRYFMDIEDISPILEMLINEKEIKNKTINVAYNNPITIPEVVDIFETELNKKAKLTIIENESNFHIPNDYFNNLYSKKMGRAIDVNYTNNCFVKYIKLKGKQ